MDQHAKQGVLYSLDNWLNLNPAGTKLTAAYQYSIGINVSAFSQAVIYVLFTKGACNGVNFKFQYSPDSLTWFDEEGVRLVNPSGDLTSTSVYRNETDNVNRRIAFPVLDDWLRIGAQGQGANFNTTVFQAHLRLG